jgi:hypothetical protein
MFSHGFSFPLVLVDPIYLVHHQIELTSHSVYLSIVLVYYELFTSFVLKPLSKSPFHSIREKLRCSRNRMRLGRLFSLASVIITLYRLVIILLVSWLVLLFFIQFIFFILWGQVIRWLHIISNIELPLILAIYTILIIVCGSSAFCNFLF